MILSGRVELLDLKHLKAELRSLERRTRGAGRDLVDHPPKGHDDLANAVAGVCSLLAVRRAAGTLTRQSCQRRFFCRGLWRDEHDGPG